MHTATHHARTAAFVLALAATATLLISAPLQAQGWVEPRTGPGDRAIEKLRTNVTVRVAGRVAEVEVEEFFRNNGGGLGEGDYVYPLPAGAVFTSYSLYQDEQELRGEMMTADRAREIYEAIVRSQRDPALIELIGKGMVRARVFPIAAGQTRKITLRYTQVLETAGDALQFRYAAGARTIVNDSRMFPLALPEREMPRSVPLPRPQDPAMENRQVRGLATPAPLTFSLVVEDEARFRDAFSPTHPVRVERARGRMSVRPDGELSGDFTVFLPFAERAVGLTVATHRPAGEAGYFMLTLSPGEVAESNVPRDVTVVVDVSGSMSGDKMDQAQRAMQQILGTLAQHDRFRMIAFSSVARPWRDTWAPATRANVDEARRWIDQLRADGGTNIHDALEIAFRETSPQERLPIVIFLTDGLPTNGETSAERIAAMAESERGRARVFAFGVGHDVNTYLLDRLSEAARGTTEYVRPGEDVEMAVSALATRVRFPVLTDLSLSATGVRVSEVYPRNLPDLFAGSELVLFGRYEASGPADITVAGRRAGRAERFSTRSEFPARATDDDYIPRLWASRKLGELDRQIRSAQADGAGAAQVQALVEDLRETALRYGLLSEYTSYLVLEPGAVAAAPPVFNQAAAAPQAASFSGRTAVARAEEARRSREVTSITQMEAAQALAAGRLDATAGVSVEDAGGMRSATRMVAGRTFTLRDGLWVDARHDKTRRVVEIAAFSDAYFAVIRALPEAGLVLRELESALIAGTKVSIRVAAGGAESMSGADLRRLVADFR